MTKVDFVLNVFERTYRNVLQPGEVWARVRQHCYPFAGHIVLVNNVQDRSHAERLLQPLLATGEITEAHFVHKRLQEALRLTGISRSDLEPVVHYSDCALVAITLPGSPYLVYADAEVYLAEAHDWITPCLAKMQEDARVAVANPDWTPSTLQGEARERNGPFALGYGFSDHLYLIRRSEFAAPVYQHWCPMSWRYPLSHFAPVFEQRVDAYMRVNRRLRLTYTGARLEHRSDEGAGYRKTGAMLKWKRSGMQAAVRVAQWLPGNDPRYHY